MSYLSRLVNTPSSSKQGVVLFLLFAALIVVPSNCVTSSSRELSWTIGEKKCATNLDCWFGGTCNTMTGICNCPDNYFGKFCENWPGTICNSGHYAVLQREDPAVTTPTCRQCDSSCAECTGATSKDCVACPINGVCTEQSCDAKLLYNNQCFDTCPDGSYKSNLLECEPCAQECGKCTDNAYKCTQCDQQSQFKLLKSNTNECLVKCPAGYYERATQGDCWPCNSACETCYGGADTMCMTCASGKVKHGFHCRDSCPTGSTNTNMNGVCNTICSNTAQFTTTANTDDCQNCDSACATCTGSGSSACTTCADDNYLNVNPTTSNSCVETCPQGKFLQSGICVDCAKDCKTCDEVTGRICTSCLGSGNSVKLIYGACITSCPLGYYDNSNNCQQCHYTCRTCSGPAPDQCLTCYSQSNILNWIYHVKYLNQCVESCPGGLAEVNEECSITCPSNQYLQTTTSVYSCQACPSDLSGKSNDEIVDISRSCSVTLTTIQSDTILRESGTTTYTAVQTEISAVNNNAINNSTLLLELTINTAVNTQGSVNREDGDVILRKDTVSNLGSKTSISSAGNDRASVQVSLAGLLSSNSNNNAVISVYRNGLFKANRVGNLQPPVVDVTIVNSSGVKQTISNVNEAACIDIQPQGSLPNQKVACAFWNPTTQAFEKTDVTTQIVNSGSAARCCSSHLTSFTIIEDTAGLEFDRGRTTYILPIVVSIVLLILIIFAIAFDCYSKKADNDKYPHLHHKGNFHKCLDLFRYSALYNFPFVGVFGYFNVIVLCTFKALWLSALVWLILIIQVSLYKGQVQDDNTDAAIALIALFTAILLIPNSFVHWILVKERTVAVQVREDDDPNTARKLKHIVPFEQDPIKVDVMTDREIQFYDKDKEAGAIQESIEPVRRTSNRGQRVTTKESVLSLCGLVLLLAITLVCWVVGLILVVLWSDDIDDHHQDHYLYFVYTFIISLVLGLVYALIKIYLSSQICASCYDQDLQRKNCPVRAFVDFNTLKVYDDFLSGRMFGTTNQPENRRPRVRVHVRDEGASAQK